MIGSHPQEVFFFSKYQLAISSLIKDDCIAVKTWLGWSTFMTVTENNHNRGLRVLCYVYDISNDCVRSELEFMLGIQW